MYNSFEFPDVGDETKDWKPYIRRVALARCVLVVAKNRIEGAWKAYIDGVPGMDHDNEWQEVLRRGTPLHEKIARVLFPEFEDVPYAH